MGTRGGRSFEKEVVLAVQNFRVEEFGKEAPGSDLRGCWAERSCSGQLRATSAVLAAGKSMST